MKTDQLAPAATEQETCRGWLYYLIQLFALGRLLSFGNALLGFPAGDAQLNFLGFFINFTVFCWIFRGFLRSSAVFAGKHLVPTLFYAAVGAAGHDFWLNLITGWIYRLEPGFFNANNAAIVSLSATGQGMTIITTILLAPLFEEIVYRELIFRQVAEKNLFLAYGLSAGLFALAHVAAFLGAVTPTGFLQNLVQYLPAGIFLAWSYQRSGSILAPLLMHCILNVESVYYLLLS